MHCLLIDDNAKTAAQFEALLSGTPGVTTVHKAVQPYLLRSLMASQPVEIVFIRVRLWDFRVFEKLNYMPVIVFLCGGKDKLTDRPGTMVPYRMREPYTSVQIAELFRVLRVGRIIESPCYFFVRFEGRFHRIFFRDIEMIERMRMSYVKIWTRYTSMMVPGTLTNWLSKLPEGNFIRVSDGLILPLSESINIEMDEYIFRGRRIPLTYRFAAMAKKELERQGDWPILGTTL